MLVLVVNWELLSLVLVLEVLWELLSLVLYARYQHHTSGSNPLTAQFLVWYSNLEIGKMQLNHNFKFPQIPQNKLSALSQLPAGARASVIQSLIRNVKQVQNPGVFLPVPGNQHSQRIYQA